MRKLLVLAGLAVMLSLASPAFSQDTPKAEVFAGYSYIRSGGANFNGWNAAVQGNFNHWFSLVGDFSGHYYPPANVHLYTYTFGPQASYRTDKITVFGRVLFGGAKAGVGFGGISASTNAFAMNFGGGVDWNVSKPIAIRLIQADALVTRFGGSTTTDPRLSFGIVFRFGTK